MTTSIALIIVLGILSYYLFSKLHLPGLLGLLFLGMIIGPNGLGLLDKTMLLASADFRKMALIVILLRAGLGIEIDDLRSVGGVAARLSIIPGILEGFTVLFISMHLFGFSFIQGGILGFIIAAVSPAVIVPFMLKYKDEGYGTGKNIPTMILAGASVDDIIAITMFTTFLGFYSGAGNSLIAQLLGVPMSIVFGVAAGLIMGIISIFILDRLNIGATKKSLLLLGMAMLILTAEDLIGDYVHMAGYLGVMAIGFWVLYKRPQMAEKMSISMNKIWAFAELCLFILVGAEVNVMLSIDAGFSGILLILAGLVARSIGVWLSVLGTELNKKEKMFSVISYFPKATVQAAIGAIPLSLGVKDGNLILSLAVLSIIITAPFGAFLMETFYKKWLEKA